MNVQVESLKVTTVACLPSDLRYVADRMEELIASGQQVGQVDCWSGFGGSVRFVINDTALRMGVQ